MEFRTGTRLRVLAGLVAFMFAALTTRLWFLQVLASESFRREASRNSVRLVSLPAPRGRIFDRSGQDLKSLLVGNEVSIQVMVNRQQLGDQREAVLFRLSQLLHVKVATLAERLGTKRFYLYEPVPVAAGVTEEDAFYIGEHQDEFPGVDTVSVPVRVYPNADLAAHVLGYIGQITADDLKDPMFAAYGQNDQVGKAGVEASYESFLQGTKGAVKYLVNAAGENIRVIGRQNAQPGDDLVLNLDLRIEKLATRALADGMEHAHSIDEGQGYLKATSGAVVVMDPDTGAVVASVSLPTYDPSMFIQGVTQQQLNQLQSERNGVPVLDRVTQGQFPPGSTFKPFIALSGLEDGLVNMGSTYPCAPTFVLGGEDVGTSQYIWRNWTSANLGYMSLGTALVRSCDTIFYPIGYEYWRIYYPPPWADGIAGNDKEPPKLPLERDLRSMGFGRPTHVDLPYEASGRIPDPMWKSQYHHDNPVAFPEGRWYPADFINMSIGQGDTLVTPMQIAQAYSMIANGRRICRPMFADRIQTADGDIVRSFKPTCRKAPFTQQQLGYVRNALAGVVKPPGTAQFAFSGFPFSRVSVAGKTGTAQAGGTNQDTSWFAAITDGLGKRYVIVAVVAEGGHGSTTAAPIVRRIIEGLYGLDETTFSGQAVPD